eukprot:6189490-Pleurochrysis_carterae.AAC.1
MLSQPARHYKMKGRSASTCVLHVIECAEEMLPEARGSCATGCEWVFTNSCYSSCVYNIATTQRKTCAPSPSSLFSRHA